MRRPGRATLFALPLALALAAPGAWAGEPADQLFARIDEVLKILEDPALKPAARAQERRDAIRRVAEDIFDFHEITRRSLGRHWHARTPAERLEFTRLFAELLERSYIGKLELYGGERITLLGDSVEGDVATVRTRIVTRKGSEIPVEYRMLRQAARWRAYDVAIEGVSLIANYRTQFDKVIQRTSFQQLVKQVRDKQ